MNSDTNCPASKPLEKLDVTSETGINVPAQTFVRTPKPQKVGWVGVIVSIFIIGGIAHFAGWDESSQPLTGETQAGITKAAWRQKALPFYNPGGGIKLTTVANFKKVVGEPSSTQTIDGHAYWYYDCADGMVQVVLIDPALSGGTLAIDSINDY
jgi:hypothetical protein